MFTVGSELIRVLTLPQLPTCQKELILFASDSSPLQLIAIGHSGRTVPGPKSRGSLNRFVSFDIIAKWRR